MGKKLTQNQRLQKAFDKLSIDADLSSQLYDLQNLLRNHKIEAWAFPYVYDGDTDGTYSFEVREQGQYGWVNDGADFETFDQALKEAIVQGFEHLAKW